MNIELSREAAEKLLKQKFGLDNFYDDQWEAISRILKGERLLLIQRTGYGKSLCFQFPAILFEGLTVVFSPLIALMRDQVNKLQSLGIPAKSIHSNQGEEENLKAIEEAKQGLLKILYIAPERQDNMTWLEEVRQMKLSMVVVDEAHCISMWGHDFRPAYRRIINLVNLLADSLPVLATTATATTRVEQDVASQIAGDLKVIRGNMLRENLRLYVVKVRSEKQKLIWLARNIKQLPGTGIIYTGTVVETEMISRWFDYLNVSSRFYNGKLDKDTRTEVEQGLLNNSWKCVVSTNALGMGIDKPDLRFIIHTQFPPSPVHYYQEIGRAGRDGLPTDIILLYNPKDRDLPEAFIEGAKASPEKYRRLIGEIKNKSLGERELIKITNFRQKEIDNICADLIDQGVIREVHSDKYRKYEFIPNSKPFDPSFYDRIRSAKTEELDAMMEYAKTRQSRMSFLCEHLGDPTQREFTNCDNTGLKKRRYKPSWELSKKLKRFQFSYFPELKVQSAESNLVDGVAGSYYGVSHVGSAIHRCKYANGGDFPDFLISLMVKAFNSKFRKNMFDFILYVPPTISGDLVRNLALKVSKILKIPISHDLIKTRHTQKQKIFENTLLKSENVSGAFSVKDPQSIERKRILLIDDIFDSGCTIQEIGKYLSRQGASKIAPLVLAKTVGGDKL